MSLNWNWTDKMGEVIYDNGRKENIYQGNAYMIGVAEDENTYQLTWFAADRDHMKNMLAIGKGIGNSSYNMFEKYGWETIRLNLKYKAVKTIVEDFIKAKMKIKIELYEE